MIRIIVICFLVLCFGFHVNAQNTIGLPGVVNYTKQVYSAGSQNWDMAQDKNGILYFANNQGLLSFDGTFWRKYPLPNKTIVRSVTIDSDNRIYVGGQSEFGYFSPDKNGELVYTSLMSLLPSGANDFTDVWNICVYKDRVFFRAYRKIFEYDKQKIIVHNSLHWGFLGNSDNGLLAFENGKGLLAYQEGKWMPAAAAGAFSGDVNIRASVPIGQDSTLLVTLIQGLYILHKDTIVPFITKDIAAITGQNLFGAALLTSNQIALISNLSGCIIIDKKGEFVQRFTKKEGIQNNNVLSVLLDKDKNLWLGLDNGIDLLLYSNAIKNIFPEPEDRNSGYTSTLFQNRLYLGLASGAYVVNLSGERDLSYTKGNFERVENSKGQVWNFSAVNGQLLMGHNSGAYVVTDHKASAFDTKTGFWGFQSLGNSSNIVLAGTYNGLNFYEYKNGVFSNPSIRLHFESARFVVKYGDYIWIAHPFKGLYKVRFSEDKEPLAVVELYTDKNHILSDNHNKIFMVGGRMILTTDNGIFEYDDKSGDFIHSAFYEKVFDEPVSYMKEDPYGNVWFSRDRNIGVLDKSSGEPRIVFIPELNKRIQADGFENINIIDSNNVLIAGEKGFFHLDYAAYKKNHYPLQVLIRNVRARSRKDSLVYGGYGTLPDIPSIKYAFNYLHFECSSILFGQEYTLEYSYYLEGIDKAWSDWSRKTEKDYTNLPPGNYVFKVKCRNNFDNESPISTFSFTILPPWYRTWWAYILYALVFFGVLYFFYKRQQQKYKRLQQKKLLEQQARYDEEQKRLQIVHQLEIAESEKEITQLRNEKLEAEVGHKNTELASSAMSLVHKVEILSKIKEELVQYREETADKNSKELQRIIKTIDGELDQAQEWEQFARHFDNVHTDYLKKLKDRYPDISQSELKLAAYLRLNLSTKEIAQLMNISIRGVETSRYRLRKKLAIANDTNLNEFLSQLSK